MIYTSKISLEAFRMLCDAGFVVMIRQDAAEITIRDAETIIALEGMLS